GSRRVPRQVGNCPAALARKMVVIAQHAVITRGTIGEMYNAHLLLRRQLLQVAIHGPQADARQAPTHARMDLLRSGVIVRPHDNLEDGRQLSSPPFLHTASRSRAREARTAPSIFAS